MSEPPKRPIRPRRRPKITAPKQEAVNPRRREAERLGRVAFHHGKGIEACPYKEDDPLRELWLRGHDFSSKARPRLDYPPYMARGFMAFQHGLRSDECPPDIRRDQRGHDWHEGWRKAEDVKKRDEEKYR